MIINNSIIPDRYKCNKAIATYIVSTGIPMLSYDDRYYYFANTELLKTSLDNMPFHLKIMDALSKVERRLHEE